MNTLCDTHELKAQARRLRGALETLGTSLTHTQSLDLIGRVHGHRDWRELIGVRAAATRPAPSTGAGHADELEFLSMHLLCAGFTAERVARLAGPTCAMPYAPMGDLLAAMLQEEGAFDALLARLRKRLDTFSYESCGVYARAWGPSVPAGVEFDALPWLMQATPAMLLALVSTSRSRFDLGNCDAGDAIAVWSAEHGRTDSRDDREQLGTLLAAIRSHQALEPDALGVTVRVSATDFACFLDALMDLDAERFSPLQATFDARS